MQFEFRAGNYAEIPCDALAFPVFEDDKKDARPLNLLDKATRGLLFTVMSSGEFSPEVNNTCLIHRPAGLKAPRLLLLGAGKQASFELATLRQLAGTALRCARAAGGKSVALLLRGRY